MREQRPPTLTGATIACVLASLANLATLVFAGSLPPPVLYASAGAAALGFAGAYGLWRLKRWGAILSIAILAVTVLLTAPGIAFAPSAGLHVLAITVVTVDLVAIVLLVVPSSRRAYA